MTPHQKALIALVKRAEITHVQAREILKQQTGDTVAERTFSAWINGERTCPGWAVKMLELGLLI